MHYCVTGKNDKYADNAITKMLDECQHTYGITRIEFDNIVKYDILNIIASFYAKMDAHQKALLMNAISKEFSLFHMNNIIHNLVVFADNDPYIPLSCKLVNSLNDNGTISIVYQTLFKYGVILTMSNWNQDNSYSNYLVLLNAAYFTALSYIFNTEDRCASSMKKYYSWDCFEDFVDHIYERHLDDINWDVNVELDVLEDMILSGKFNSVIEKGSKEEFLDAAEIMGSIMQEHCPVYKEVEESKGDFHSVQITGIKDLNISARARACLLRAGYKEIAELKDISDEELLKIKNINMDCVREIRAIVDDCFETDENDNKFEDIEILDSESSTENKPIVFTEGLDELKFSVRTYNCLKRAGLNSLQDVCKLSFKELMSVRNLGGEGFEEVLEKIRERCLSLQGGEGYEDSDVKKAQAEKEYPIIVEAPGNSLIVERDDDKQIDIEEAFWKYSGSLYVPFLKIRITNKSNEDIKYLKCKALFYNTEEKELWDDSYDTVVSGEPLKPGYGKISSLSSTVGYANKLTETSLPSITAQLFVNGKYYGDIDISKSYSMKTVIRLKEGAITGNYSFFKYDEREYGLIVANNQWKLDGELYVPSLNIEVTNQTLEIKTEISIRTVFYDLNNKKLWGEITKSLITSERPLLPGYKKTAFINANQGYSSKLTESSLPTLYAEIYADDELYGQVKIENSYENLVGTTFVKNDVNILPDTEFKRKTDRRFYPVIVISCWTKSQDLYVPYLKIDITNQQKTLADSINVKVVFTNSVKMELWSEVVDHLIGPSDTPLKTGYKKSSFIRGTKGYTDKIDEDDLPGLMAEVFINGESYGEIAVQQTYEYEVIDQPLKEKQKADDEKYTKKDNRDFYPIVKAAIWENVGGNTSILTGTKADDLFAPSIQIDVINQKENEAKNISVKAVFYDLENKNLWSDATVNLVSSSDTPLKQGFRKTAFLKASVGYGNQIDKRRLPKIDAEIYINDVFYGSVLVDQTYDVSREETPLEKSALDFKNDFVKKNNMDFYPVIRQRCWMKNSDIYAPFIRLEVTNQLEEPVNDIRVKAIFHDKKKKEVWTEAAYTAISSSVPLRAGFNVDAFLRGNRGYKYMIDINELPELTADVYINDFLYGSVDIKQEYDGNVIEEPLVRHLEIERDGSAASDMWNTKSFLGEMGYSTSKPDYQRRYVLEKAVKEFGKQRVIDHISFLINMRLAQNGGAIKFSNAIRKWRADLSYVRDLKI